MKTNILYISPDFNYSCGVSRNVYQCLKYFSSNTGNEVHFITNKGDSFERLNGLNIKIHLMKFEKDHKNFLMLIRNIFSLLFYCKKNKISLIHSHHRYTELLSFIVAKILRIKTITTVHSFVTGMKNLSFKSDKVICVSKAVKKHLSENYSQTVNKSVVIYNCIEEEFFNNKENPQEFRTKLELKTSDKVLLFLGRINKVKGVDLLLDAFKMLITKHSDLKLLLIGEVIDKEFAWLKNSPPGNVIFLNPTSKVLDYYALADLIILPSRNDPFPYVMLEAGALKKPFIGSKTGGIKEFIKDGVNGHLFEPENAKELAEKILYALNNPNEVRRMSDALYDKVKKENDCRNYFSKLEKIYKDLQSTQ